MIRSLIFFLAAALTAGAQPRLSSASPQWIQRGTTTEVTISGERLHSVTGIVVSGEAGLSVEIGKAQGNAERGMRNAESRGVAISVESGSSAFSISEVPATKPDEIKSLKVKVVAATNAVLGPREIRVVASNGVSAPITLNVAALPQVAEAKSNRSAENAQVINVPATVEGTIAATESDWFRFKAAKDQTVVIEVDAARRGSALDSTLVIADSAGKELARGEDEFGFDSIVRFTAPADGDYLVQLRDFQHRGGGGYSYRLSVGAIPFIDSAFPYGGRRGTPVDLTLTGHNLSGNTKTRLVISPEAPPGRQELRLQFPSGLSNPLTLDVQDLHEVLEVATNGTNTVTAPAAINGRIEAPADVDAFLVKADADQKIIAEVLARRFGSPLDPLLLVYANGSLVAQNDDASGADARLELDLKKGTDYVFIVRDLTGRGGISFGYRLLLRKPQPTLTAKFFPDTVRLHRGGVTKVRCEISRGGFDGPVSVNVADPVPGVAVQPLTIPAGATSGTLVMQASEAASIGTVPIRIKADATVAGTDLAAVAAPVAVTDKEIPVKEAFLTILDPAPVSLEPLTLSAAADQTRSAKLEFFVRRLPGFTNDVVVSLEGFSAGRDPITKSFDIAPVTVKAADSIATLTVRAKTDAEIGTRHVFARAEVAIGGETNVVYSSPVPITVTQIPFVVAVVTPRAFLTLPRPGSTSAVEEVQVKFRADRRGFNAEIPLTLEGIPEGVTVAGAVVPAGAGEATVLLTPTASAKPGTNYSFTALGTVTHNDRIYRHKSGAVKLMIEAPAAEIAGTNAPPK